MVRQTNNFLQVCKQLGTMTPGSDGDLDKLREVMGVAQHHDAVSGTAKQVKRRNFREIVTRKSTSSLA